MTQKVKNAIWDPQTYSKSYSFSSPVGTTGKFYSAGYYDAPAAHKAATQAAATQTYGGANHTHAAHAFIVAGGAGNVAVGAGNQVGLKVSGTSINDQGVRAGGDEEVLTTDITTLVADQYLETTKKWNGTITFSLYIVGGAPATYDLNFNYGLCKYDDYSNKNFVLTGFECVGLAGANDTGFNIELLHHKITGWTYDAAAFVPGNGAICDMNTDHGAEKNLAIDEPFAYKRDNLNTLVNGGTVEGFVIRVTTGANRAVQAMSAHVKLRLV
jgi:hypothetical protein